MRPIFFSCCCSGSRCKKSTERETARIIFYGKVAVDFFICDKKMVAGMTLRIPLRLSQGEFVFLRKEAAKYFKVKKIKQIYLLEN